jgi:hypothetical protein
MVSWRGGYWVEVTKTLDLLLHNAVLQAGADCFYGDQRMKRRRGEGYLLYAINHQIKSLFSLTKGWLDLNRM